MKFKHLCLTLMCLLTFPCFALDLELTQGINAAIPIGMNGFGTTSVGQNLADVISHDLQFSGQFSVIYPDRPTENLALWKHLGAESMLDGTANCINANTCVVNFTLKDVAILGKVLLSEKFTVRENQLRQLSHHISDLVYQKLTGQRGVFSTRIAYILVNRSYGKTRYSLEIADMDGSGPQSLLVSSEPIMSPTWSPDGSRIAYVSFEKKKAQIFDVVVATGQRRLLTDFYGINGAPAWSPDGRKLAVVLSKSGSPKIYSLDLTSGNLTQLTFGNAIDTEPRFSPDGREILFTSGRGGSPQIYRVNLNDGKVSRVTYHGNYNARSSYTPDGKNIVILHRDTSGRFNIAAQSLSGGNFTVLTDSQMDESPSVAPNGKLVVYATKYKDSGVLGMVSIDGKIKMRLPSGIGDVQEPAWSPY
jgi:TolB protein